MKEVPILYVRANQAGIVLLVLLTFLFQMPLIILLLWTIQTIGLLNGVKGNLFIQIAKPYLENKIAGGKTEAVELQRFNNMLAVIMLTVSVLFFMFEWMTAGYVLAGMVGFAALAAICGYCIGCTIYFQFKQWKSRQG